MQIVYDLDKEIKRIIIAGQDIAKGDKKLTDLSKKLKSHNTPILTKISSIIDEATASGGKVLELATLVKAVLNTLAKSYVEGDISKIDRTPYSDKLPPISYKEFAPVLTALTSKGGGRYSVVAEAIENESLRNPRLAYLLIGGLDDPYSDIVDVVKRAINRWEIPCADIFLETFDLKKNSAKEIAKFEIIESELYRTDKARATEFIEKVAKEGTKDLKLKAIENMYKYDIFKDELIKLALGKDNISAINALAGLFKLGIPEAFDIADKCNAEVRKNACILAPSPKTGILYFHNILDNHDRWHFYNYFSDFFNSDELYSLVFKYAKENKLLDWLANMDSPEVTQTIKKILLENKGEIALRNAAIYMYKHIDSKEFYEIFKSYAKHSNFYDFLLYDKPDFNSFDERWINIFKTTPMYFSYFCLMIKDLSMAS